MPYQVSPQASTTLKNKNTVATNALHQTAAILPDAHLPDLPRPCAAVSESCGFRVVCLEFHPLTASIGAEASMNRLHGHTVFDHLYGANVPLRASACLRAGISAALWDRDEIATAHYDTPSHHTLSLYVSGGENFHRRAGQALLPSLGPGSLCLMPRGASSAWEVRGPVRMFHLYISRQALDRFVAETLDADPAALALQERFYF